MKIQLLNIHLPQVSQQCMEKRSQENLAPLKTELANVCVNKSQIYMNEYTRKIHALPQD